MRYSSRFWLYAPITAFLTIAVVVMVHWWFAAKAFEKSLVAMKDREAIPGITLNWTSVAVSGFPFRLDADFENFAVHGAAAHGLVVWTSKNFALHSLTYGRRKTVFEAAGAQYLQWMDGNGQMNRASFLPGTMRGSSITDKRGLARFDLDVVDAAGQGFTARRLQFHLRRDPDGTGLDVMARADDVKGAGEDAPLVEAYVTLRAATPLMPLLAGKAIWPDAVRAWRSQKGEARLTKGTKANLATQVLSGLY